MSGICFLTAHGEDDKNNNYYDYDNDYNDIETFPQRTFEMTPTPTIPDQGKDMSMIQSTNMPTMAMMDDYFRSGVGGTNIMSSPAIFSSSPTSVVIPPTSTTTVTTNSAVSCDPLLVVTHEQNVCRSLSRHKRNMFVLSGCHEDVCPFLQAISEGGEDDDISLQSFYTHRCCCNKGNRSTHRRRRNYAFIDTIDLCRALSNAQEC